MFKSEENKNLLYLKRFFKSDSTIKKLMLDLAIDDESVYSSKQAIEKQDLIYKSLKYIEYEFLNICKNFNFPKDVENIIKKLFNRYQSELISCSDNPKYLKEFYKRNISDMRPVLVEKVKENFNGYLLQKDLCSVFDEQITINEILHIFHAYITNDEKIYGSLNVLDRKINQLNYDIVLYGENDALARQIFDYLPLDIDCGQTDIIAFDNKILMMIRDKGHALSIEIEKNENNLIVNYFIPKICNTQMVNMLKGVNKVKEKANNTTGMFISTKEDFLGDLYTLINMVPTDADIDLDISYPTR